MGSVSGKIGERGPLVQVKVMPSEARVRVLRRLRLPLPPPVEIAGLIDSGASISAIDRHLVASLGLRSQGTTPIHTPSTGTAYEERDQYDTTFVLGEGQEKALAPTLLVIACDFASEGFLALIGRDVLRSCEFHYCGPRGTFTLDW